MDEENAGKSSANAYAELRKLLLPEGEELSRLKTRVADPRLRAEDISEALPQALRAGAAHGPELRAALRPLVEEAIRISVQKNPAILASALSPALGRAARGSLSMAFERTGQRLRRVGEQNLTWRGLGWRWQSLGAEDQAFRNIALAHSTLYRVEQVFLIHRATGLLLAECGDESGLLTEIQDFVRDSPVTPGAGGMETLHSSGFAIWMVRGPHAVLAAVLRGAPPRQLQPVLQHTLDQIESSKASELENFSGDPAPFLSCEAELSACLLGQGAEQRRKISPLWWLAAAILLEAVAYWIFTSVRENRRWDDYLARLHHQPGIVVTNVERQGPSYVVNGLRDPLAVDPVTLLPGTGVDPKHVVFHWEPYHSLQPAFETVRRLINEKQIIENQTLHFGPGSSDISEEDIATIDQIAAHMRNVSLAGKNLQRRTMIEVIGHTDGTVLESRQDPLGQTRAEAVRNALIDAGVPPDALIARDAGATHPLRPGTSDTDRLFNRYVSFHVN